MIPTQEIAKALYTINRHAKTAPDPKHLYFLKKTAIERLLKENRAKKIGLHFSEHPRLSNQHSTLLIQVEDYFFHILPSKQDFRECKHLGNLDQSYRNPQTKMPLSEAKKIICKYIGYHPKKKADRAGAASQPERFSCFTPSSLGKLDWRNHTPSIRKKK